MAVRRPARSFFFLLAAGWLAMGFPHCRFTHAEDGSTGSPRPAISPADERDMPQWHSADRATPEAWEPTRAASQTETRIRADYQLIDFSSRFCGPCQQMAGTIDRLIADGYPVKKFDVQDQKSVAEKYGVTEIPCVILLEGGQVRKRLVGIQDYETLAAMMPGKKTPEPTPAPAPNEEARRGAPTPDWSACPPLYKPQNGTLLADIDAHMPVQHEYRDADFVTWAHETTHGIASRLRKAAQQPRLNAFYCLKDRSIYLIEPNLKLADVAARVPPSLRGEVFQAYMDDAAVGRGVYRGRTWNDQPLYILDEWTAYCNGASVGLDYGPSRCDHAFHYDVLHCLEFAGYANALLQTVDELDPDHKDKKRLQDFVAWQTDRSLRIAALAEKTFPDCAAGFQKNRDLLASQYNATAVALQCSDGGCGWQRTRWLAPRLFSPPIIGTPPPPRVVATPQFKSPPGTSLPTLPPTISQGVPSTAPPAAAAPVADLNGKPIPGPAGPSGKDGSPGPAGPAGPQGRPGVGVDPSIVDSLQAALDKPITVNIIDASGKIKQTAQTKLGGTLNLQLVPVKPTPGLTAAK